MNDIRYDNFMDAFRDIANDIEKIVERLDKLIELQGTILPMIPIEGSQSLKLCSVCGGKGIIPNPDPGSTSPIICKACGGTGWVKKGD